MQWQHSSAVHVVSSARSEEKAEAEESVSLAKKLNVDWFYILPFNNQCTAFILLECVHCDICEQLSELQLFKARLEKPCQKHIINLVTLFVEDFPIWQPHNACYEFVTKSSWQYLIIHALWPPKGLQQASPAVGDVLIKWSV